MKRGIVFSLVILYLVLPTVIPVARAARKNVPLAQGIFLVATPGLMDPNFTHTVILLVAYGKEGSMGLIINRPTGINLHQVLPDVGEDVGASVPLFLGGPVDPRRILVLFYSKTPPEGAHRVVGNVYFTGNKDVIMKLINDHKPGDRVRVYAGYAGWAGGQLESEMTRGTWITMEANPETIFAKEPLTIWPSIFKIPENIMALLRPP